MAQRSVASSRLQMDVYDKLVWAREGPLSQSWPYFGSAAKMPKGIMSFGSGPRICGEHMKELDWASFHGHLWRVHGTGKAGDLKRTGSPWKVFLDRCDQRRIALEDTLYNDSAVTEEKLAAKPAGQPMSPRGAQRKRTRKRTLPRRRRPRVTLGRAPSRSAHKM
ncbi:hypothetical protein I350_01208 [Cryptococcus amylolentus CBS 6273]|uniref:Uncharacterized protein n=1 Tax=Cryptococcus amylolentus CBS 6273 TaxID=1296118 RepID=A0A1E3KC10_9TREE|nr:hypothetical protein I350_01208 [Cryptococcus amylolentus CBS 6273]